MTVFFPLTNHLHGHEDEANGAGDEKLPSGQMSCVTFGPRHGVRLLAEPVRLPRAVHTGGIFTQLWCRVWICLLWRTHPERRQNDHWFANINLSLSDSICADTYAYMRGKTVKTYHVRGSKWVSIRCCFSESVENSITSVTPFEFNLRFSESCHLLQTHVIWQRWSITGTNGRFQSSELLTTNSKLLKLHDSLISSITQVYLIRHTLCLQEETVWKESWK